MEYTFTEENINLIKKFIDIRNRGHFANAKQLTKVYNEVLHENKRVTTCGTCLRGMTTTLEKALKQYEAEEAQKKAQEAADTNERGEKGDEPTEEKKNKRGRKPKKANGE